MIRMQKKKQPPDQVGNLKRPASIKELTLLSKLFSQRKLQTQTISLVNFFNT